MFQVVELVEVNGDLSICVALDSWIEKLNGEYLCYWPPANLSLDQLTKIYKTSQTPNKGSWTLHNCKILAMKETMASAKKKADKIISAGSDHEKQEQALLPTDDEGMKDSRASRKKKPSPEDYLTPKRQRCANALHPPRKQLVLTEQQNELSSVNDSSLTTFVNSQNESQLLPHSSLTPLSTSGTLAQFSNKSVHLSSSNQNVSKDDAPITVGTFKKHYSKLMAAIVKLQESVDLVATNQNSANTTESHFVVAIQTPAVVESWPLLTMNTFLEQEATLENEIDYDYAVTWLSQNFSDKKWGQMTRNILTKMLSIALQQEFTFSERAKSPLAKFENTLLCRLTKDAVKRAHSSVPVDDIKSCIQNWLQHKTDRKEENKRVKLHHNKNSAL